MNDQLEQIGKMLRAQLQSAGHIWWIGGYVYGATSNGDPFIILYPAAENLKEKIVRVYNHDFRKLPAFIKTDVDGGDTEANPNKEQAKKTDIYHECPAFEIVTYDGRETQMGKERRFGDVLRLSKAAREAVDQAGRAALPGVGAQTRPAQQTPSPQPSPMGRGGQQPPPPDEPPDDAPAGAGTMALPDYRKLAIEARTEAEFDYAAYMALKNGLYTAVSRITAVRQVIVIGWKPSSRSNAAMLLALEVYRDKRSEAEARGEAKTAASAFAKREAMGAYNVMIKA